MWTESENVNLEREYYKQLCIAFCSAFPSNEEKKIRSDLMHLMQKQPPPSTRSLAAIKLLLVSPLPPLPEFIQKHICQFARLTIAEFGKKRLNNQVKKQMKFYSRNPGDIVLRDKAVIGERVKYRVSDIFGIGTIISTSEDSGTEIAVRWGNGGHVSHNLQCGKKGNYQLIYAAPPTLAEIETEKLYDQVQKQRASYSRNRGDIVLRDEAAIGERVRYRGSDIFGIGTIISTTEDGGTEIAVRWDKDGKVSHNLQCGKKCNYQLVYA